jgi:hypothetical protein
MGRRLLSGVSRTPPRVVLTYAEVVIRPGATLTSMPVPGTQLAGCVVASSSPPTPLFPHREEAALAPYCTLLGRFASPWHLRLVRQSFAPPLRNQTSGRTGCHECLEVVGKPRRRHQSLKCHWLESDQRQISDRCTPRQGRFMPSAPESSIG